MTTSRTALLHADTLAAYLKDRLPHRRTDALVRLAEVLRALAGPVAIFPSTSYNSTKFTELISEEVSVSPPPSTPAVLESPRYLIQSAATTLEVLLAFGRPPHRFSPAEIAQSIDIDRNQAFRCLRTLQYVGFIRQDEGERFVLTSLVEQLASASQGQPTLARAAKLVMDELSQSTGETVNLFSLDGLEALCVDHREGLRQVRLITIVAERRPLHAGACPKAMLAVLPRAQQDEVMANLPRLPAYTDFTLTTPDALAQDLQATRDRGYAISNLDVDEEARGVGAAIFNAQGEVIGAVSVGGPASRMTPERISALGQQIVEAARLISRQLGFNAQVH